MTRSPRPAELKVDPDGTIHVPAFAFPLPGVMSEHSRQRTAAGLNLVPRRYIPRPDEFETEDEFRDMVLAFRSELDEGFARPMGEAMIANYPVTVRKDTIGGVPVEVFEPSEGLDEERVLINLHGGAFYSGAVHIGRIESVPVAATGKFRVISVDYRQGFEHRFPAASEDVAAVYEALLRDYSPAQIGIFGGSAGGVLTLQATAWIIDQGLPVPGAIGVFGAGTAADGDSVYLGAIGMGYAPPMPILKRLAEGTVGYFAEVSDDNPLVNPSSAAVEFQAKFPPTLLITGTRAFDLSPAISAHRWLCRAGVDALLHVFDGQGHCFYYDASSPEGADAYDTIFRFFRKQLGRN